MADVIMKEQKLGNVLRRMSGDRLSIQPVLGASGRKLSYGVLDTAESLMDNIDDLAEVLDQLTEKYEHAQETLEQKAGIEEEGEEQTEEEGQEQEQEQEQGIVIKVNCEATTPSPTLSPQRSPSHIVPNGITRRHSGDFRMFRKLKSCLDSTRHLISSLRREKGRLMKRELSVECRMSEMEDYKSHIKQDLTSLNDLVDMLTERICELELRLADGQEEAEGLTAERDALQERLDRTEALCAELNEDNDSLRAENGRLHDRLRLGNRELQYEIEVIQVENVKLKELVREFSELEESEPETAMSPDGDLGVASLTDGSEDLCNNNVTSAVKVNGKKTGYANGRSTISSGIVMTV
ncbi:uncharacterized protein LOC128209281 isoform X2 [Mya arenaria]|uniref:uncharacterized protein LOC128209281 isoform X2 n=1 Tax=Mya arenaria TaxID=6604 RepID=UPI0022E9047E|nr:uncharacterized protein LOC128209281 isoform X2 [Mya arenaria]